MENGTNRLTNRNIIFVINNDLYLREGCVWSDSADSIRGKRKATAFIMIHLQSLFLEEFIKIAFKNFG